MMHKINIFCNRNRYIFLLAILKGVVNMGQSFNAPYEAIGEELLSQLVDTFYERVKRHPPLLPDFFRTT